MVLEYLKGLLSDRYGCEEEDVCLAASLDELNLSTDDVNEMAVCLQDLYGVEFLANAVETFETVEDIVGYVEDRL